MAASQEAGGTGEESLLNQVPNPQTPQPDDDVTAAESKPEVDASVIETELELEQSPEAIESEDPLQVAMAERDTYLADLQRVQAEFANFRRQATKRQSDTIEHAATALVNKLLPVLDACDAALLQGAVDVEPIQASFIETLRKEGLEVLADAGELFDPERHEAVIHDDGGGGDPTVVEIMRSGYLWNGRVLRPAMVRVAG